MIGEFEKPTRLFWSGLLIGLGLGLAFGLEIGENFERHSGWIVFLGIALIVTGTNLLRKKKTPGI